MLDLNSPNRPQRRALLRHIQAIASGGVKEHILPWLEKHAYSPHVLTSEQTKELCEGVRYWYDACQKARWERDHNRAMIEADLATNRFLIEKLAEELKTARRALGSADALLAQLQKH